MTRHATPDYVALTGDRTTPGSIKRWLNNNSLDSEVIIAEAEQTIYHEIRAREMLTHLDLSFQPGDDRHKLPEEFRRPHRLKFDDALLEPVLVLHNDLLANRIRVDGELVRSTPSTYAISNDENGPCLLFDAAFVEARTGQYWYYRALPPLSVSNPRNFLTNRYPTMLRNIACLFGAEFMRDDSQQRYWAQKASASIMATNVDQDRELEGARIDVQVPFDGSGGLGFAI